MLFKKKKKLSINNFFRTFCLHWSTEHLRALTLASLLWYIWNLISEYIIRNLFGFFSRFTLISFALWHATNFHFVFEYASGVTFMPFIELEISRSACLLSLELYLILVASDFRFRWWCLFVSELFFFCFFYSFSCWLIKRNAWPWALQPVLFCCFNALQRPHDKISFVFASIYTHTLIYI